MLAGSTLIYRKLSSPPQALRSSTTRAARHKMKKKKKKIGAEFMTSVSYRPEVIMFISWILVLPCVKKICMLFWD